MTIIICTAAHAVTGSGVELLYPPLVFTIAVVSHVFIFLGSDTPGSTAVAILHDVLLTLLSTFIGIHHRFMV